MPKYLDMHGLETLTGEIENTYLKKNQKGAAGGVATLDSNGKVPSSQIPSGTGGTTNYSDLTNKPQINGVTLTGNKTSSDLGIDPASPDDIVVVSDSTPTDPDTRIWFPETPPQPVSVPTTAELQAVTDSIAPDYSDLTFPVAAGKACIHEGTRYVANQAIQSSETWTAAHWDEESVEEALSAQKTEINSKADEPTGTKSAGKVYGLDNSLNPVWTTPSGGGMSSTAAELLYEILKAGVYTSDQSTNIADLATALNVVIVTQSGTTLILSNVPTITSVTQNDSTLVCA